MAWAAPPAAAGVPATIRNEFCSTQMGFLGYGKEGRTGNYVVNKSNYMFTQNATHRRPWVGARMAVTREQVVQLVVDGITASRVLAGYRVAPG